MTVRAATRGDVLDFAGTLTVETCPACGVSQGVPTDLIKKAHADHSRSIYCPNGHSWHYTGETDAERETRYRKQAEDRAARIQAELDRTEASRRAWKGQTTKLRNRAAAGQCVYCGRTFANVLAHVSSRHPGETPRELAETDASPEFVLTAPWQGGEPSLHKIDPRDSGAAGGKARAAKLTPAERSAIASKAALARWARR